MHRRTTPKVFANAKELRHNMIPAEHKLWTVLRNDQLGVSFRRQYAIGLFITDFCCIKKKLIIELDGTSFGRSTLNRNNTIPNAPPSNG